MLSSELKTQINHTLYSIVIILTAYIIGKFPEHFYLLHAAKTAVYLLLRFVSFKKRKFHYYMCDYCYCVNLFSLYVSLVEPNNLILQKILFVSANGPLALSIIVFKNKIVLHSPDHNTSVFIHLSAMLLSYVNRWETKIFDINLNLDLYRESYLSLVVLGLCFYIVWSILYGILMFVILRQRILTKGNMTMFDWAVQETGLSKLKNISKSEKIQQILYSCFHGILTTIGFLISPIFWFNQTLHFCYIIIIITVAFWNGSKYYVYKMKKDE
jgi:hypothetical protein